MQDSHFIRLYRVRPVRFNLQLKGNLSMVGEEQEDESLRLIGCGCAGKAALKAKDRIGRDKTTYGSEWQLREARK